jgi:hypothetical protein
MKAIEYVTTVSKDGRFSLPHDIMAQLDLTATNQVRILLLVPEKTTPPKTNLSQFTAVWEDDRNADEIVAEIYADRDRNIRTNGTEYGLSG